MTNQSVNKNSTVVKTDLNIDKPGTYFVTYEVQDSDKNTGNNNNTTSLSDENYQKSSQENPNENSVEIVKLDETDDTNIENFSEEEDFIESIQGNYEDELSENIEE